MADVSVSRTEADGCSSGSSSSSSVRATYPTTSADEEGACAAHPTVNLASWQQASSERYTSMASMLEDVKRDINNLSERLRQSPYLENTESEEFAAARSPTGETAPPSSDELAHSVRESLADMGRRLREAGEPSSLAGLDMDLQMDSFPSPVSPREAQMDDMTEDELFLNPFQQQFIRSAPAKTWRSPSDVSSAIAGDLAMSGDYAEFSDRTRLMLQRIRRERHDDLSESPPGSPTFEVVECGGMNIEDFILGSFIEEVEPAVRFRSLPTILEERPEDLPPSSSSSSSSASSSPDLPAAIEMQDMTTDLDDSPRGGPLAGYFYGTISSAPNLALMVESDAEREPGFVETDEDGSTTYFSMNTSDSETFVTVTDDDREDSASPQLLKCGTLFYAHPSAAVLQAATSPFDCCESSDDSDDGGATLGRTAAKMWSPEADRPAPDGSTAEETPEVRREESPPAKVFTFVGVTDSRRRNLPDNAEPVVVRAPARRTFTVPPPQLPEENRRLSAESDDVTSEQSTLSELIADTGEPASEYSTETATETDSSDSCSDPGEDYVADMLPTRTSATNHRSNEDKKRKGFKPTLPPAAVYKPPLTKRPKMSSITESRSSDEEATSDDDSEQETIGDQPPLATTIGRENNDAQGTSINQYVNERVEHENCDNGREILTGTPNSELALSRAAGVHSECSEDLPSRKEAKIARESDLNLSRSSSTTDDQEFEDAMEDLPHGRTEVKQEVIPANDVTSVRKGPVVAIASSRALIRRGANFAEAPKSKPLVSTEVKAEATGASPSIAAARATAKAASIATATASPQSPSSEDLHIYISTSCTIRSQTGLPPDDLSLAVTRRPPAADFAITDAHQLPRPPASDSGSEAPQRENIFTWLDSGDQVATTTHELPSHDKMDSMGEMHTLESAAFQVLEQHTRDSAEARRLAGQVVSEVQRDRDLSAPSVYSPRPFSQQDRYSEMRRSLENLQRSKTSQAMRRADVRAHRTDPRAGSQFVEMSDVSLRKIPQSAPGGRVESTFISDSSGSTSPDDRSSQSRSASERYRIRPEYRSVLQAPIDLSANSYTRSGLASSTAPIKGNLVRRQDKRSEFFTPNGEERTIGAIAAAEMKLAALRSDNNALEHSRPTSASSCLSAQQARLREVVDDDTLVQQQQHQRRRRHSCRNTDIDEAIRSSTRDLTAIDANGYDELGTAPGKFFSVSLYDLNATAGSVFSPPPTEGQNPAKTFFADTAKSLTSLLQTDIDTGTNAEEPLVIETDVDTFSRDSLGRPSKARSMVDLIGGSPLMSPTPLQTYDLDLHLNRTQSMMLPQSMEKSSSSSENERSRGMTLRERLEMKAKSQTEMRIAKSLTKLHVPHWLDNVPMESERAARERQRRGEPSAQPQRPHSASSVPSLRRPVVIETRVLTPNVGSYPRPNRASTSAAFELPSQKFRNSFNEKLQPIRSKLRDSLPNLFTGEHADSGPASPEANTVPRKASQLRSAPPLQPIRLDATDFAPKRTVRQVKREKTVETRTVQRSEIVLQGGGATPVQKLTEGHSASPDGGQSSPDSGYVGSRTWPQAGSTDVSESPQRSVKVTETTLVEQAVRRGGEVVESDRYRTATHEEWTDADDAGSALRDFVHGRFDQLTRLAQSERPADRAYVLAVSDAVRFFGLTEPAADADRKTVSLDDDEVLAALTDSRRRGVDVAALLAGENNAGHSLLHAGIVTEQGRHYLQCVRDQCRRRQLLVPARRSFTSCPACFTYYCSELCATWDRTAHLAHCACSRLTGACQKVIRCVHSEARLRHPIVRLAHTGCAAFGRGFVLVTFADLHDARRFLSDADNDLTLAPCFVPIDEPTVASVFGKSVESMRTACNDYDTDRQFVIVVAIANKSSDRSVKKCATLPVGDEEAIISHDEITAKSTAGPLLASVPAPRPSAEVKIDARNGIHSSNGGLKDSDGDTIDSSEDSETGSSSEGSSSSSDSETETEEEEKRRQADEIKAVRVKQEQAAREQASRQEARLREEEMRRKKQEEEMRIRRQEEETRRKRQEEEMRKQQLREQEMRKRQEEEMRKQQQLREEEMRKQQLREQEMRKQQQLREEEERKRQEEEDSSSGSETESTSDSDSESSQSSEPEAPPKPKPGMVIRARQMPVPARPPPRPPVQNPPQRPVARAVAQLPAQSPSGSISSLGSFRSDSSATSSLDRPGRQALLEVTERKMLAHGVDLRRHFPELHAQLVRFTEQNLAYPRRTVYPTDARTGRRLACTFVCGREPIIQVVPQSGSNTSSPRDSNFNVQLKKSTVETEL